MLARRMLALVLVAAAGSPFGATLLVAQNAPNDTTAAQLAPGTRVKFAVVDAGGQREWSARQLVVRGKLTDIRTDSLVLELGGTAGRMTVARSALIDLSVSRGTQFSWRTHPTRSVVSGALLAAEIGLLASTAVREHDMGDHKTSSIVPMISFGVGLSAYTFVKSAFSRVERWEAVK